MLRILALILSYILIMQCQIDAKVRILTFHCNLPYLLEMQCKALNKFVIDDFELIVLNDASNPEIKSEIEFICNKYGAQCIRFEPQWHQFEHYLNGYYRKVLELFPFLIGIDFVNSPSLRHSRMIQYGLEAFGHSHDDIVVILDGDAFPIRTISLRKCLENRDIIGSLRAGVMCEYLMPVFVAFDPRKLAIPSDFQLHFDYIHNHIQDTGAYTYFYMQLHPEVNIAKVPFFKAGYLSSWNQNDYEKNNLLPREIALIEKLRGYYYEVHMDWHIFHFKGSSHRRIRNERNKIIHDFLDKILSEERPPLREISIPNIPTPFPGDD